ncbi:MAG: hypothetical protein M3O33_19590 [Cyanobacteriota bacterium]|nr:hypothetical protein [Cyanobacteriota bacterium]
MPVANLNRHDRTHNPNPARKPARGDSPDTSEPSSADSDTIGDTRHDSQPNQTMLQPATITMPSAAGTPTNPSTEPIKTQQLSPQSEISPMKSSQENSLTSQENSSTRNSVQ